MSHPSLGGSPVTVGSGELDEPLLHSRRSPDYRTLRGRIAGGTGGGQRDRARVFSDVTPTYQRASSGTLQDGSSRSRRRESLATPSNIAGGDRDGLSLFGSMPERKNASRRASGHSRIAPPGQAGSPTPGDRPSVTQLPAAVSSAPDLAHGGVAGVTPPHRDTGAQPPLLAAGLPKRDSRGKERSSTGGPTVGAAAAQGGGTEGETQSQRSESKESLLGHEMRGLGELLITPVNTLLIFVPLGFLAAKLGWSASSVFIFNFLGLVPLANLIGSSTEELSMHTGEVIGGLLNASFGNAVEMILTVQSIRARLLEVTKAQLFGSVISNLLLVLGSSFFCGGLIYVEQSFNERGASSNTTLLLLAVLSLAVPNLFHYQPDVTEADLLAVSRISAVVILGTYLCFLVFQLYTHLHFFTAEQGDGVRTRDETFKARYARLKDLDEAEDHVDPHVQDRETEELLQAVGGERRSKEECVVRSPLESPSVYEHVRQAAAVGRATSGPSVVKNGNLPLPEGGDLYRAQTHSGATGTADYRNLPPIPSENSIEEKEGGESGEPPQGGYTTQTGAAVSSQRPSEATASEERPKRERERGPSVSSSSARLPPERGGGPSRHGSRGPTATGWLEEALPSSSLGMGAFVAASLSGGDEEEEEEEEEEDPAISAVTAIMVLASTTIVTSVSCDFLVNSIQAFTDRWGVNQAFIGVVLLPIVGNAVEHWTAISVAVKGKMDLAIGVAAGSSCQVSLLVIPFAVLVAWSLDVPMTLDFKPFETVILSLSVLIVIGAMNDGKSNWLEGVMLMAAYLLVAVAFWFDPDTTYTDVSHD